MTAPQNTAFATGSGVVNGDQLNTFVQWCPDVATLRGFIGLTDMTVFLLGLSSPGDGGQGTFYWNATSAGPDDGVNTIVPSAATVGAWIRNENAGLEADFVASGTVVAVAGTRYIATGAFTLQLPSSALQTAAFEVSAFAYGGAVTLSLAEATDTINGGSAGVSLVLPIGYGGQINNDAAGGWYTTRVESALGLGTIAAATTTNIGSVSSPVMNVTGSGITITGFGTSMRAGQAKVLVWADVNTLVNSANLILQNGVNQTTAAGDLCIVYCTADGATYRVLYYGSTTSQNRPATAPQGRLTLTTGTPVMTADVTAGTTVYYTPYAGTLVPIYDGANTTMVDMSTERALALDSNSGHTGYQQSGYNFDLFIVNDSGTIRLVTGPAWASDTARSAAISRLNGFLVNSAALTAKYDTTSATLTVAQYQATYVGTMRASADGQCAWVATPAAAAGGGACTLYLWNAYNRVSVSAVSKDSTDTWNYTTATWRAANASNSNRISLVVGVEEDFIDATYIVGQKSNAGGAVGRSNAIGIDSTSTPATNGVFGYSEIPNSAATNVIARFNGFAGSVGFHYFQALEYSVATNTTTWLGDNGTPTFVQMALIVAARM